MKTPADPSAARDPAPSDIARPGRRRALKQAATVGALAIGSPVWLGSAQAQADDLAAYRTAKINWRQAEGESISVAVIPASYFDNLGTLLPQFEALTGIRVRIEKVPPGQIRQKSTLDLSSKTGTYATHAADPMYYPLYVANKWVDPLDRYLNDATLTDPAWYRYDDILKAWRDADSVDGKPYGIPYDGEVTVQVLIGLALALLLLQIPNGQGPLRVAAILPIVLAPVVVGLFWRTLVLAPDVGLVDMVSRALGLGSHNWLGDPQLALISVIAIHTWQWTPFAFLVLLATLATLPPDVYEAARLDRARAWQRFRHITLPLIRPAIVMVIILRMMTALSAFAAIFAATGGGPGSSTEILNLYAYRTSFSELNIGYGASLAVVLMAITMSISYLMFRLRRAR